MLVTLFSPYLKATARPSTFKVLQIREHTPTPHSFVVFTLDSHLCLLKSLGVCHHVFIYFIGLHAQKVGRIVMFANPLLKHVKLLTIFLWTSLVKHGKMSNKVSIPLWGLYFSLCYQCHYGSQYWNVLTYQKMLARWFDNVELYHGILTCIRGCHCILICIRGHRDISWCQEYICQMNEMLGVVTCTKISLISTSYCWRAISNEQWRCF
jgi:hypothetical protein